MILRVKLRVNYSKFRHIIMKKKYSKRDEDKIYGF